jgi:hypothetical protein
MPSTRGGTERPRAALLQLGIESWGRMCRIGGRLRSGGASSRGATGEIPPFLPQGSNLRELSSRGTVLGGQFDWGGRLLKGNGGAQRSPQVV